MGNLTAFLPKRFIRIPFVTSGRDVFEITDERLWRGSRREALSYATTKEQLPGGDENDRDQSASHKPN